MHNRFEDKNRRFLNLRDNQVKNILPEHFIASYPKFISLLTRYYEWQDENDSTELLNHLFAARDITATDITLLSYIEDELLLGEAYFKGFGEDEIQLRAAANFSNILFRSKGTKFAIEWFFRSFYGEDVEVLYPKKNIFNVSDQAGGSTLGADALRYLTDDKLYQTFAVLIRVGIPIQKWKEIFKLFVHPAGMYLGGEVLLVDTTESVVAVETDVETYTSYGAQIGLTSQITEGDTNTVTVTANSFRNGGKGYVYWWGEHLTTVDSDFGANFYDGTFGLPDSNEKQYLEIENGTGTFDIITAIDPAIDLPGFVGEGTEQFKVFIGDEEGRVYDEETVTVLNNRPVWGIQGGPTLFDIDEGQTQIVQVFGDQVENFGNTTLLWHFDSVNAGTSPTLWDSDFAGIASAYGSQLNGLPDSAGNALEIEASYFPWNVGGPHESLATFNIQTRIDGYFAEAQETAAIRVLNKLGIPVALASFNINNVTPTINVTANDLTEGGNLSFDVTVDAEEIGKTFEWEITGAASSRFLTSNRTGSVTFNSATETVVVPSFSTTTYEGPTVGTVTVTNSEINFSGNDTFTMNDLAATYAITANPSVGTPGNSINFEVSGTNIPNGTDVYFYASGAVPFGGAADADPLTDFSPALPISSGSREPITITSNVGALSNPGNNPNATYDGGITVVADADATDEYYEVYIYNQATGGTELAEFQGTIVVSNNTVTFTGEKNTAGASYTAPADEFVNEGTYQEFTFSTDTYTTGQTFYYWIESVFGSGGTTVTSADFVSGWASSAARGTFTVDALGDGIIETQLSNDLTAEGDHRFKILVSNSNTGSAVAELGTPIRVVDTSQQEYSIVTSPSLSGTPTQTTFDETEDLYVKVTMTSAGASETLYCELTGTGASQYTTTQETATISTSGSVTFGFISNGDNSTADGNRTITIKVARNNYASSGGEIVQTAADVNLDINRTLTDPGAGFTLVAGDTTPNEGDTVAFTVGGSSIPDGTYYYRPSDWITTACSSTITSGTFIPLTFTTGIQNGWTAELEGFGQRYVTNVSSNGVTLSSSPGTVVSGTVITFAPADEWDFFDLSTNPPRGSVTVTSNSGSFNVNTVEDPGLSNLTINFSLYDGQTDVEPTLVTEQIVIQNITAGSAVEINSVPPNAQDATTGDLVAHDSRGSQAPLGTVIATSFLRFNTDGTLSISGTVSPGADTTSPYDPNQYDISVPGSADHDFYFGLGADGPVPGNGDPPRYKFGGNWVGSAPILNGSDYRIRVTGSLTGTITIFGNEFASTTNLVETGSIGTWLTMNQARTWSLAAITSRDGQDVFGQWALTVEIEEIGTSNATTETIFLRASAVDIVQGDVGDGEFACFLPGTQILLENGTTKNIEDMQVGEKVLGNNGVVNEVIELRKDAETSRRIFSVNDGLLKMTGGHLLLTTEGWAAADARIAIALHPEMKDEIIQLETFQELVLADGSTTPIYSLTYEWMRTRVYNLNVTDGDDTYVANGVVGQPGVVVHNK